FSSRRRHTRSKRDWSSDVCSSDLNKKEYRKYKVSIDKNDDYNTMKEVIYRRYFRALLEKSEMPDLILVDGGENQIRACKEILNRSEERRVGKESREKR